MSLSDICSICLDQPSRPVKTPCLHIFCRSCITGWLDRRSHCPVCRASVRGGRNALLPMFNNLRRATSAPNINSAQAVAARCRSAATGPTTSRFVATRNAFADQERQRAQAASRRSATASANLDRSVRCHCNLRRGPCRCRRPPVAPRRLQANPQSTSSSRRQSSESSVDEPTAVAIETSALEAGIAESLHEARLTESIQRDFEGILDALVREPNDVIDLTDEELFHSESDTYISLKHLREAMVTDDRCRTMVEHLMGVLNDSASLFTFGNDFN